MILKFSLLFLLAILMLSLSTTYIYKHYQTSQTANYSERLAQQAAKTLDTYFLDLDNYVRILAINKKIIDRFAGNLVSASALEQLQNMEDIQQQLGDIRLKRSDIYNISIFSTDEYIAFDNYKYYDRSNTFLHEVIKIIDSSDQIKVHYFSPHTIDYYYLEQYPSETTKVISLACPVRDIYKRMTSNLGYVMVDVNVSQLGELVKSAKWDETQQILILDENGTVIFSENQDAFPIAQQLEHTQWLDAALYGNHFENTVSVSDHEYLLSFASLEINDWKVIVFTDTEATEKTAQQSSLLFLTAAILTIVIVVMLAAFISGGITKPIYMLVAQMERIRTRGRSDLTIELAQKRLAPEIKQLYAGYNTMMDQIERLIEENYEAALRQKDADFKMLQAQINPHFLNNILQMIQAMAVLGKNNLIRTITTDLGGLLQYSIYEKNDRVYLRQEIDYINRYIELQNIRFDNSIDYRVNMDPALGEAKVPKFILQPIVENSVIHGFEGISHKELIVTASADDEFIYLVVEDHGIGIPEAQLKTLLSSYVSSENSLSGIGLKNINERIKLIYGAQYSLQITSEVGKGTTAKMVLPKTACMERS